MAASFKKIHAKSAKLITQLGYPHTFGQFVARFAAIIGATEVEFIAPQGEENQKRSPGEAVHMIDQLAKTVWETCRKREGMNTEPETQVAQLATA